MVHKIAWEPSAAPTPIVPFLDQVEVMAALGHDRGARVTSPQEARRPSYRQAAFAQIEFATDSPLEGTGFEPSVPRKAPDVVVVSVLGRADFSVRGVVK